MQATSTFVLKSIASDQSLAQSPTKADRTCNKTVRQATLQATSKTTWNSMTSDQSLAESHLLRIEKTIHNIVYTIYNKADTSDHASDQTEYTWTNHKRPVACRIAHPRTNIRYINRHVASDHSNIHKGTISDQVACTT